MVFKGIDLAFGGESYLIQEDILKVVMIRFIRMDRNASVTLLHYGDIHFL